MKTTILKRLLQFTFYSLPLMGFVANFTEPRAQATLTPTWNPSLPLNVIIHKRTSAQVSSRRSREWLDPLRTQNRQLAVRNVKAYVQTQALEYGVNPLLAVWIVRHESQFNRLAKGDGEASRGLWQISKIYHPEVSDAVAFDIARSTAWSLERLRAGKANEWSTYRFCRELYEDCPF